jgi:hypothetical protein
MNNSLTLNDCLAHSWTPHVPNIESVSSEKKLTIKDDLNNLRLIVEKIQTSINSSETQQKLCDDLIHKCCEFSLNLPSGPSISRTFRIFEDMLKGKKCRKEDLVYIQPLTFEFDDGQKLQLPAYFKKIMGCESDVFKRMFEGNFNESDASTFHIGDISKEYFEVLLGFMEGNPVDFETLSLDEFLDLATYAQKYNLVNFFPGFTKFFEKIINRLYFTSEDFETVLKIQEHLFSIDLLETNTLFSSTLGRYFGKYLSFLETEETINSAIEALNAANVIQITLWKGLTESQLNKIFINKIKSLKYLNLSNCSINDEWIERIHKMQLSHLSLENCKDMTDKSLSYLKEMQLIDLNLLGCPFTDQGLISLCKMPLKRLNLYGCASITNKGLQQIENLKINELNISNCKISDEGLIFLKKMPLQILKLNSCNQMTGLGFDHLINLPIDSLEISNCYNMKSEALLHLRKIKSLTDLNLDTCYFSEKDLECLKDMNLKKIRLSNCKQVNDLCLKNINWECLVNLNLDNCELITNDGFLKGKKLKTLSLLGCKGIDLSKFKEFLPINFPLLNDLLTDD